MKGRIRIIGGQWRGRKLAVPDRAGLRPSGDRSRETLFNWLSPALPGARVLDLFAGTGALGLEALSRGAEQAVFVERDRGLAAALDDIAAAWPGGERMNVICGDAMRWLSDNDEVFDIVFLDPPFGDRRVPAVLEALSAGGHLAESARVYVEQGLRDDPPELGEHFELLKEKTLGEVRMSLLGSRVEPAL